MLKHYRQPASPRTKCAPALESLEGRRLLSATFYVSPRGNDANTGADPTHAWKTIQQAMNLATPGSTVLVHAGVYGQKLTVNVSGNATDGFITFQAQGHVVINGAKSTAPNVISLNDQNYIQIIGFNIQNDLNVSDGAGISLNGSDDHVNLLDNTIHNIRGVRAAAITAYGSDPNNAITNLVIDGNTIFNCQPLPAETLTVNGNVHDFQLASNYIHNVNNIGIDVIGGEGVSSNPATDFPYNGEISGNRVTGAHYNGTGRDAAGIFVDGAHDVVVERNTCWRDDVGIEVNAVNAGATATGVIVRDNDVFNNNGAGISIGASQESDGVVQDCQVLNNTLFHDEIKDKTDGEIRLQWGSSNTIENNLVDAGRNVALINGEFGSSGDSANYNLYYSPDGGQFDWDGFPSDSLSGFQTSVQQDVSSIFANPLLIGGGSARLRLNPKSPAINAGDPAFTPASGETDFAGNPRLLGPRVDIGAVEAG